MLDGFQGFLFGALGRLETALVFVVEWNGRYDGASLFAESTGVGSGAGQFTVQYQLVHSSGLTVVVQQCQGDVQSVFVGMSGRYSIEYHCHLRVESYFSRILFAALYFEVLVDLALGCGLSSQTSKGGIDASADLLGFDVSYEYQYHVFGDIPLFVKFNQLAQAGILQMFGQADDGTGVRMSLKSFLHHELVLCTSLVIL